MPANTISKYTDIPKIELHLHLEGAIPIDALWSLCEKYGADPSVPDIASLDKKFVYKDFPHFIEAWMWKNKFLKEYEDFTFIAESVARDLAKQNINYAEVFYSPPDFAKHGLKTQEITSAIRSGLNHVPEIEIALIADLVRDFGTGHALIELQEASEVKNLGVIGIGIGGSEQAFPPEPFEKVYAQARRMGFHTNVHAGEAAGAESIWGAIRTLHTERIGHGTRAYEDPSLLDYLAEKQIPLEMCPVSNLKTGVVQRIEDHPIRRYFMHGIQVTVNTDDPKMFGNSLAQEYDILESKLGFSQDDIYTLIKNAVNASWLPADKKQHYLKRIQQNFIK
jgi:adenosine deaminase